MRLDSIIRRQVSEVIPEIRSSLKTNYQKVLNSSKKDFFKNKAKHLLEEAFDLKDRLLEKAFRGKISKRREYRVIASHINHLEESVKKNPEKKNALYNHVLFKQFWIENKDNLNRKQINVKYSFQAKKADFSNLGEPDKEKILQEFFKSIKAEFSSKNSTAMTNRRKEVCIALIESIAKEAVFAKVKVKTQSSQEFGVQTRKIKEDLQEYYQGRKKALDVEFTLFKSGILQNLEDKEEYVQFIQDATEGLGENKEKGVDLIINYLKEDGTYTLRCPHIDLNSIKAEVLKNSK